MARKRYQGASNDKQRSMQQLIRAVGVVLRERGYTGLTATNIAKAAGLDRRLISLYFGSVETLVGTYVRSQDYWVAASGNARELAENNQGNGTLQLLETLLLNQLSYFYHNDEMQKIVLWEISQRTEVMRLVCEEREQLGSVIFALTDQELAERNVDLRAIAGLLVAGIYYLVLHAKTADSLFCEIDLNQPEGFKRIENAISLILKWAYNDSAR